MSGQLEALMFGRLLEVTDARLAQALIVCSVALLLIAATWKEQVAYAFDRTGARASGLRLLALDLILNTAIAAAVVSASTAVGILLIAVGVSTARERLRGPALRAGSVQSAAAASTSTTVGAKASADPIGGPEDSARVVTPTAKRSLV